MPKFAELDWYETPRWYDAIFDTDTPQEVDFLEQVFAKHGTCDPGRRKPKVLEPACGSGRLMVEMGKRGWSVAGFDLSKPMLDYARDRLRANGLRGKLAVGALEGFDLGTGFHLAHCLVCTFQYVASEEGARSHLRDVAKALAPGGVYVLGFHLSDYTDERVARERWTAKAEGKDVICTIQGWPADKRTRTEQVRSRLRVVAGDGSEQRSETNWTFRSYDARQVRKMLKGVPELEHVATYDFCYDIDSPRELNDEQLDVVLILRKRV
ncbi:class I SAM-dependent methyltransferase [Engelhardtia mirabilis]|uniref:Mg-protoporphyrin IX methyl transferase n=1 Tax=Engelhardtia mirabilis TaxID=2528011 RepID=A0A518BHS4_9BACT|nr:Mg-protoporphyrin IX methyl transferase [Planctomycetes bacterium Pla133]QDV00841.1 Mg-protoporphyrin IX methyl transferase [Planctomycetes bacterium Pla86]